MLFYVRNDIVDVITYFLNVHFLKSAAIPGTIDGKALSKFIEFLRILNYEVVVFVWRSQKIEQIKNIDDDDSFFRRCCSVYIIFSVPAHFLHFEKWN